MKLGIDYSTSGSYKPHESMPERTTYHFHTREDLDNFEKVATAILSVMNRDTKSNIGKLES